jgi:hypothetical protein
MQWETVRGAQQERQSLHTAVVAKLYEICTRQGYVDDRDWEEAVDEVRTERAPATTVPQEQARDRAPG